MVIQLDETLHPDLYPLSWLVGTWAGAGVIGYPGTPESRFGQEVEFAHDGRRYLTYTSQAWLLDEEGQKVKPLARETGFWRPAGAAGTTKAGDGKGTEVELLLAHPTGFVEIYVGEVEGPRINLRTDLVARVASAKEYTAATRMYGLVEGDLLWVLDMAAMGHPLQSHASARLKRVES